VRRRSRPRSPRPRSVPRDPSRVEECAVSRAAHRRDIARPLWIVAELVAKPPDVYVDRSVEHRGVVLSIERIEKHLARDDSTAGAHQRREKAELGLRQRDALVSAADLVTVEVDREIAERERCPTRLLARFCASQERFYADDQLRGRERLRQIVVGTARD